MTEDEMVGWHHQLNEHEFEHDLRVGDGQGRLAYCSPWGHKESDMTKAAKQQPQILLSKALFSMVFPVVMYRCENWTVRKAERQRIDTFELWYWRGLLRVPWTARHPTSPF